MSCASVTVQCYREFACCGFLCRHHPPKKKELKEKTSENRTPGNGLRGCSTRACAEAEIKVPRLWGGAQMGDEKGECKKVTKNGVT